MSKRPDGDVTTTEVAAVVRQLVSFVAIEDATSHHVELLKELEVSVGVFAHSLASW